MSSKEKLIKQIKKKPPRNDIEFDDLVKVYEYYGFNKREGKGSHVIFTHSVYSELYTCVPRPHGKLKTVKRIYVKILQEFIEYLENKGEKYE